MAIANTLSVNPTRSLAWEPREFMFPLNVFQRLIHNGEEQWTPSYVADWEQLVDTLEAVTRRMKRRNRLAGYDYPFLFVENLPVSIDI